MRNFSLLLTLFVLCSIYPSTSNAQMSAKSFSGRKTLAASEKDCPHFVDTKFTKTLANDFKNNQLTAWTNCVTALETNIPDPTAAGATVDTKLSTLKTNYNISTPDEVDIQLITTHYLSRRLRQWATLDPADTISGLATLDGIDRSLHTFMSYTGLLDPFAGSLIAGPVFGDTGKLSSGITNTNAGSSTSTGTTGTAATSSGSNTNTLAHIEWSSKHFGEDSWSHFDFSFGGSFGLQPALSLLTNPPPTATATPTPAPTPAATPANSSTTSQFQSAFVWTLNGRTNIHVGSTSEASGFVRIGQLRLLTGNGATIVDQGANSTLQIPLNSNADRMSWFYETGIEYNFYNKSLEIIHADKGQLQPAFNIGIAYKHDSRFSQSAGVVGFDSPDQRLVFRFLINGLKIIDRRPDTTTSKPYAISFGVEHERGFGANPVPSGTQLIIRGDINLLKLINP
ncbi:MAG TPA: hypothetical protein VGK22_24060 [Candidatus Angelobacter sp.]